MDCGPTCLRMIAKYYGKNFSLQTLREISKINKDGASLLGLSEAAENRGFRALGVKLNIEQLREVEKPCILHWRNNHFVVLYKIKRKKYFIADPANSLVVLSESDFINNWLPKGTETEAGVALLLTPTPVFFEQEDEVGLSVSWSLLIRYLFISLAVSKRYP